MLQHEQIEELIRIISTWRQNLLIERIQSFSATFPVDFTHEYLEQLPEDRLRHLFLALCLQQKRIPKLQPAELI
ncbi:MAG TPA: hypothetical protein VHD56_09705 [Tepidisphaeraceae bacterium]|nr:hypothetical protein [Tepidisphaeraceae bacterium]